MKDDVQDMANFFYYFILFFGFGFGLLLTII